MKQDEFVSTVGRMTMWVEDNLTTLLPSLELVFTDSTSSYDLKNDGARGARGEFVGILDGDCVPERGWVRHPAIQIDRLVVQPRYISLVGCHGLLASRAGCRGSMNTACEQAVAPRAYWKSTVNLAGRAWGWESRRRPL